jgi:hypothetical protein
MLLGTDETASPLLNLSNSYNNVHCALPKLSRHIYPARVFKFAETKVTGVENGKPVADVTNFNSGLHLPDYAD